MPIPDRRPGSEKGISKVLIAVVALFLIYFAAAISLALAANTQGLLTKEEASSGFVNPTFLQFRLQHHLFSTNFYAYVYFLFASKFAHGLFFSRFSKVAVMSTLPCFLYLYLRKRFDLSGPVAFTGALAIALLPGLLCFSWIGMDVGMEEPIGCCALWLALFESTSSIVASCFLAAVAAESYGPGMAFLVTIIAIQASRLSKRSSRTATLAAFAVMVATLAIPLFWWTNAQTLLTGGGGLEFRGMGQRLASLTSELVLRGDSYYFFSYGWPALGSIFVGFLALCGLITESIKNRRQIWPLLLAGAISIGLYSLGGNVIGVRRAQPLVVVLGIFACVFVGTFLNSRSRIVRSSAYLAFGVWMAIAIYQWQAVRAGLSAGQLALPRDFDFYTPPGQTMASTVTHVLDKSMQLPEDLHGYEPDRTMCILYRLSLPRPLYSPSEIISRCDQHGWSIPSSAPRLMRIRSGLRKLYRMCFPSGKAAG